LYKLETISRLIAILISTDSVQNILIPGSAMFLSLKTDQPPSLHATWIKKFNATMGSPNPDEQKQLANRMQIKYKAGVGELIWAMTTCRPDIAFTSVKLSQSNSVPAEHHYHGLKHAIRYLYIT
jgi:hypothetical protein